MWRRIWLNEWYPWWLAKEKSWKVVKLELVADDWLEGCTPSLEVHLHYLHNLCTSCGTCTTCTNHTTHTACTFFSRYNCYRFSVAKSARCCKWASSIAKIVIDRFATAESRNIWTSWQNIFRYRLNWSAIDRKYWIESVGYWWNWLAINRMEGHNKELVGYW